MKWLFFVIFNLKMGLCQHGFVPDPEIEEKIETFLTSESSGSHHTNSILSRYKFNSFWNNFDHLFYLKFVDLYQLLKYSCFVITWHHIDIQLLWLLNWIPEGSRRWIKIADCEGCHEYCPSPQIQGCVDIPSYFFFF